MRARLFAGGVVSVALLVPASGSAQAPPPCAPGQAAEVQVTTRDRAQGARDKPLYATREVAFTAHVQGDATNVELTSRPGVKVLKPGANGRNLDLVIPKPPSVAVAVSWEQPASSLPGDPARCSASKTLSFPVLAARPPKLRVIGKRSHLLTFTLRSARTGANLDPIELTLRRSSRAALPSPHSRALRWSVPMRPGERKSYSKKIPAFTPFLSDRQACRYWYFSCGAVFSQVKSESPQGAERSLSFKQPSRWAAPFGILVATYPMGLMPRHFGFDIQARQAGRLLARFRRAGVCREVPGMFGGVASKCTLSAIRNYPR
jgi:hypothetical protein